jgi:hypothetical protein
MRRKILVFLDHPIIVRHFVDSGAFSELDKEHDLKFVVPPEDHKRIKGADLSAVPSDRMLRLEECRERSKIWAQLFQIETLRDRKASQARTLSDHQRYTIGKKAVRIYSLLGNSLVWLVYQRYLKAKVRRIRNMPLEELIDREKPDLVLHPTVLAGIYINDLIDVCRMRKVPVVGIMNSWDNPSTKRAVVGHLDWLLVWGRQTRDHATHYMGMKPGSVVRFGAAQLDIYRQPPRTPRGVTRAAYGIEPDMRLVLYAGSSKGSDEFQHLMCLEAAIEAGELPKVVVVYRPHPWGDCGKDGGRIADQKWKHVRFENSMRDYIASARSGPQPITTPDYRNTHDILAATDILISPVSTILLEAALNGIPNICLVDDLDADNWFLEVSTRLAHFREYFEIPEFLVANSVGQMIGRTREALGLLSDAETPHRIKQAARYFVDTFEAAYPVRLLQFVEDLFREERRYVNVSYFASEGETAAPHLAESHDAARAGDT